MQCWWATERDLTQHHRPWLCQCIRSSPVLSSLRTEFRASVIFGSVSARTSYLASNLLYCTQCICLVATWKKQTTSVPAGRQMMSCAALLCLCMDQCCQSCPAHPAVPQHDSTVVVAPDTQQIREKIWCNICQLPLSKKLDSINIYPLPKKNTAITLYHIPVLPYSVSSFYWQV